MNPNEKLSRRQMLKLAGLTGLTGALLPASVQAQAPAVPDAQALPAVPRRALGKTGADIPILLMGGSMKFDQTFDPRFAECMRFGVNYFDMADCYSGGTSEIALGNFLERTGRRSKTWITTKSCKHDPKGFEEVLNESLKRLKTDHVDLMFLHGLREGKFLSPEMKALAERLKKEGKIKHFGFSCHNETVAQLLDQAAGLGWVDAIMFKYNFREYGNAELNKAMDACHKAGIGLIAMKTQGSAISFADRTAKFEGSKFTKGQAVLKAVWEDERITAAVSSMDTMELLKENIAAALDKSKLEAADFQALERFALSTKHTYCAGCQHICNQAVPEGILVGTTLRYLMYHDTYATPDVARDLFAKLPLNHRDLAAMDFSAAEALCPNKVAIGAYMKRAAEVLA